MRTRFVPSLTALLCASTLSPGHASGQAPAAGLTYAMKISTDSGQGGGGVSTTVLRYQTLGTRGRMDITQAALEGVVAGMYMINDDADSTLTTVMPANQMAMIMNPKATLGAAAGVFAMEVKEVTKNELLDVGAGERMLGLDTHRYRLTQAATIVTTIMGQKCERKYDTVSEVWMAGNAELAAFVDSTRKRFLSTSGGDLDWMEKLKAAHKTYPKGLALRTVAKNTGTGDDGKPVITTTTVEVTELTRGSFDAAVFSVPAGYQTMDIRAMMAAMPPGALESAMASGMGGNAMPVLCPGKKSQP